MEKKRVELLQRDADRKERENRDFWEEVEFSEDPYDNLEGLANYLHKNIGATGVYIGQLQPPHLKIQDDADEQAHLDLENPEVIKFKFANSNHKDLMVNQILPSTSGISHDVFSEEVTTANQEFDQNPDRDALTAYKHVFVPEVVREPRMHYWQVPRLGSFMAVPLVYKSCLNITSFDKSVEEYKAYKEACNHVAEEKRLFEAQQEALRAEKIAIGEDFEPEHRDWIEYDEPEILFELKKFVVCIDYMGQDKVMTDDQKRFILNAVLKFKRHWETFELKKLIIDRDALLKEKDDDIERFNDEKLLDIKQKEEFLVE